MLSYALLLSFLASADAFVAARVPRHASVRVGAAPVALLSTPDIISTTSALASIIPGGVDYDNTGNGFWDRASDGAAGDISQVGFLAVLFPLAICLVFYKDNFMELINPTPPLPPPGWKEVPSRSRPGKFSWKSPTGEIYDKIPYDAYKL